MRQGKRTEKSFISMEYVQGKNLKHKLEEMDPSIPMHSYAGVCTFWKVRVNADIETTGHVTEITTGDVVTGPTQWAGIWDTEGYTKNLDVSTRRDGSGFIAVK